MLVCSKKKKYLAGYILKSSVLEFCGLRGLLTLFSNDQMCQNLGNIIIGLYYTTCGIKTPIFTLKNVTL